MSNKITGASNLNMIKIFMPDASKSEKDANAKDKDQFLMPLSTFYNLRDNILYNIDKDNAKYISMFVSNPLKTVSAAEANDEQNILLFGFIINNGKLANIYGRYYNKIEPSENVPRICPDIIFELNKTFDADRNIISFNINRAELNARFATNKSVADHVYYGAKYVLSYLHAGRLCLNLNNVIDIKNTNNITNEYINSLLMSKLYTTAITANIKHKPLNYVNDITLTPTHKLVSIPADMQKKLLKIAKYFAEVKSSLILNEDNGYYCYKVEDILIPIICTHEYMTLEGESPEQIALKCYNDGKCKYCDQEISAYQDQYREELPTIIYSLIMRFIDAIMDDIDSDALHFALFNTLYDVLSNIRKYRSDDGTIVAVACIYLYKVYISVNGEIKFNSTKILKFADTMRKYCAHIGWSNQTIDSIMNDAKYIPNTENMANIIKSFLYSTNVKYCDTLPLSILFGESINPTLKEKLTPHTEIQKLYVEGWHKMQILNNIIDKSLLKIRTFTAIAKNIDALGTRKLNDRLEAIAPTPLKNGRKFYNMLCETYCPCAPTNLHKFDGDHCRYCGIKKNMSNKEEIYEKYQVVINTTSTQLPNLNTKNVFNEKPKFDVNVLQKYDPNTAFTKYITPRDHRIIDIFNEKLKENMPKVANYISRIIHIPVSTIELKENVIKQYLCYIVDMKLDSVDKVVDELKYIFITINNKHLLLLIYTKSKDKEKDKDKEKEQLLTESSE